MTEGLDGRLAALAEAADIAEGRLAAPLVAAARRVVDKAGARLGFGLETTVVALAGATGVGKSHLFNALTGAELATVSRRRPTTPAVQAAVWGEDAEALLDWLSVARRTRLAADELGGMVLLDLPDFDSIETSHRLEAERIVGLADLVLWVVEPQKYADAALHERYLRPLASHAAAMALVLNQADLLPAADIAAWRRDATRLLVEDGLGDIPLVVVSAETGAGIDELRRLLQGRVAAHDAAVARLAGDLQAAADGLGATCGDGRSGRVENPERAHLAAALEDAAGVPSVVRAVAEAHRRHGALATGWPLLRWVRRLRPDPLRRLRPGGRTGPAAVSLPPPDDAQRAQVATAARGLADRAGEGLRPPWPGRVREAALAAEDQVADRLARAVARADLHVSPPRWWRPVGWLQRALLLALGVGAVWLMALAALAFLRIDEVVPLPELAGVPIPTWLLLGGAAVGVALALLARAANGASARRRARAAAHSLRAEIAAAGEELVIHPVERELEAHASLCAAVASARGPYRRRQRRMR